MKTSRKLKKNRTENFARSGWIGCLLIFIFLTAVPSAHPAREKTVEEVEIIGNRRINRQAIAARIKTRPGEVFSQKDINADLRRLHEWGPFSSLEIDVEESRPGKLKVIFRVEEKPIINKIVFEGNRKLSDGKLEDEISSEPGDVLSLAELEEDIGKMLLLYEDKGYLQTEIEYQVKTDPGSGEATVYFNIREGHEVRIERITIEGAEEIDEDDLLDVMETSPRSLFAIFHRGILKEEELEDDLEKLVLHYRSEGFLDMKITAPVEFAVDTDRARMSILIKVDEGRRYYTGKIKFSGNENFGSDSFSSLLDLKTDGVFSYQALRDNARSLRNFYAGEGYIDAGIRPQAVLNRETGKMDIEYIIQENQISYINRIEISGNETTKDIVIRRELAVRPGDIFDGIKVQRSQERLYNLGYFDKVLADPIDTGAPNQKDLQIRVTEKKTGEFMFGFGYSSIYDFIAFVEVAQTNFDLFNPPLFMGGGQKLIARATFGTTRDSYWLGFTEPWLFGIPLSFSVDLYRKSTAWDDYRETRKGGDLRLRRRLTGFIYAGLTYRLEQVEISEVEDDAYWTVFSAEGKNWISSITPSLTRDTRDSNIIPSRGMKTTLSCEIAGGALGGDEEYVKTTFSNSFYQSIFPGHILCFRFMGGAAQPYGDSDMVPVFEKFYLGGANTIRGFRYREVGPFDPVTEEPIGGDSMLFASVEYTFPIVGDTIRGALFCDIGNVWADKDWDDEVRIFENEWLKGLNSGAGIGVRLYLPIGPLKFDYGWPLRTGPDGWNDTGGRFHFNIGYAF